MDDIRHRVKQGECIRTIAAAYGFAKCRPIIEYEKNSRLREKRPDMTCLFPGDVVFIPPKRAPPSLRTAEAGLKSSSLCLFIDLPSR